jgi:hypothetical protein
MQDATSGLYEDVYTRFSVRTTPGGSTADCDDIDPYARQCHALHCGHALLRLLSGRDGGEYRWSALW